MHTVRIAVCSHSRSLSLFECVRMCVFTFGLLVSRLSRCLSVLVCSHSVLMFSFALMLAGCGTSKLESPQNGLAKIAESVSWLDSRDSGDL